MTSSNFKKTEVKLSKNERFWVTISLIIIALHQVDYRLGYAFGSILK